LLLGRDSFPAGDFTDHFLPFSLFQRSELLAGRLPLWNPYTFTGHPFLADVQAAVFYPISNLVMFLTWPLSSAAARLYALQVEALVHFVLAGFFTYLLAFALLRRWLPAFLAGAIFALSGYLTGYPALQLAVLRTAVWLPLVLWLLLRAFQQPALWRWWIGAALAYAVAFVAGHPQTFLHLSYALLGWIALLLYLIQRQPAPSMTLRSTLGRIVLFYGLTVGLSAAQLLPSLEFTRLSVRASADYAFASGGLPLADTWQMLLPGLTSLYTPLYVGVAGLGLALLALAHAATSPSPAVGRAPTDLTSNGRWFVAYFGLLALLSLLISYGRNGFLYRFFFDWLPGWDLFQGQERAAYLTAFGLSMLAGFGAAALDGVASRWRRGFAVAFAFVVAAAVAGFIWRYHASGEPAVSSTQVGRALLAAGLALAAFSALLWIDRLDRSVSRKGRGTQVSWRLALVSILALAELFGMNRSTLSSGVPLAQQAALPAAAQAVQLAVQEAGDVSAVWGATSYQGPPGRAYNEHRVFEDYGMRTSVEDLGGSSPLRLSRYAALLENYPLDRLWQLTGVEHVLNQQAALYQPAELLAELPGEDAASFLHRLAQPTPRAWIVNVVQGLEDGPALPLLADARFDPSAVAILPPVTDSAARAGFTAEGLLATPGENNVTMQALAPGRLRFDVQSQHGGLLVISENWMPGWQARVSRADDETSVPAPVVRADVTLLGVPVDPGQSVVELTYRPASVRLGLLISGVTLALLALLFLWRIGQRRTREQGQDAQRSRQAPATGAARKARWPAWAMVAVLLAAFGLRVLRLDYQELRGDEVFGYFFSLPSLAEIVRSTLALREPHPVASYFLQKGWLALAGHSEFALRFATAWFGTLAVALIYKLGRRLGLGAGSSTLAAALLAISPYAIWHSQDARMYSISLALTLASTILALEALARQRWRWWLAYVAVSWLALQTHYFAVFIIVAQNAAVLLLALTGPDQRRRLGRWLASQALLGLLYLPWLIVAVETLTGYRGNGDSPGFGAALQRALSVFAVGETVPIEQRAAMAVLAGVLLVISALRLALAGPAARRALLWLALYLAVPLLVTWISALQRPIFNERYLIAAAPPFFLLAAIAVLGWGAQTARPSASFDSEQHHRRLGRLNSVLAWIAAAALGLLLASALGSLAGYYADPDYSKTRGWRELAAVLERYSSGMAPEHVRLVQNFPDPTLWYYYDGPVEHLVLPPAPQDADRTAQEVQALVDAGVARVVLPLQPADNWDNAGIAAAALARSYELIAETRVGNWPVQVYARPPAEWTRQDVRFANGLLLAESAVPIRTPQPGDVLPIYMRWQGSTDLLSGSEKLTLQLLDATGRLAAQFDQPFGQEQLQSSAAAYPLQLPLILAPGSYRLIAALYDPAQEGAPRLLSAAGTDAVELGVLEVR
jgi:hypothetical protein